MRKTILRAARLRRHRFFAPRESAMVFAAPLEQKHVEPFDRTYRFVTQQINEERAFLVHQEAAWLGRLVEGFQAERDNWNRANDLVDYRRQWRTFRTKLLRLVAGAYLHIGYDLPRALANDWPGAGAWTGGPDLLRGQAVYFRLRRIFPISLRKSAKNFRTIGWPAIFAKLVSDRLLDRTTLWVNHLRACAWIHAQTLTTCGNRPFREFKMAEAMTAALEDASDIRPLSTLDLLPPDSMLFSAAWLPILINDAPQFANLLLSLVTITLLSLSYVRAYQARLLSAEGFVNFWGALTSEYIAKAVNGAAHHWAKAIPA
jgi:hypothetical protein